MWWPPMIQVKPSPKLDAATLPIGTVMVLGGDEYEKRSTAHDYGWVRTSPKDGLMSWCCFSHQAIDQLIRLGVEFCIPEAKP